MIKRTKLRVGRQQILIGGVGIGVRVRFAVATTLFLFVRIDMFEFDFVAILFGFCIGRVSLLIFLDTIHGKTPRRLARNLRVVQFGDFRRQGRGGDRYPNGVGNAVQRDTNVPRALVENVRAKHEFDTQHQHVVPSIETRSVHNILQRLDFDLDRVLKLVEQQRRLLNVFPVHFDLSMVRQPPIHRRLCCAMRHQTSRHTALVHALVQGVAAASTIQDTANGGTQPLNLFLHRQSNLIEFVLAL
mmetsp:Transcript_47445/g.78736  ORF Transcript_47445/g.78736 Transcript_47445/m.78736 type:complete len:244 (-) Transcript_47445:1701-2432(-)